MKQDFLEALCRVFDDDSLMTAVRTRTIPTLAEITVGSSFEAANLAASQFFSNQNAFLKQFEGIPILQFLLMGCALSPVFQSLSLSSLELAKAPNPHDFAIISPVDGETYTYVPGVDDGVIPLTIEITEGGSDVQGVTAKIDGGAPFALEPSGSQYVMNATFTTGKQYAVEFLVVFLPDYWLTKTCTFTVELH